MKILSVMVILASVLLAGDAFAEKLKVDSCIGCHGLDGRSRDPDVPNLAGQKERYLAKALRDFRMGNRQQLMMNYVAKEMSDEDIEDYAAYYAGFQ
ncbi:MAG: cytochrome c [Xanthomonadales bacterium]|nr:cytochrome c [Xanthomonadales bacterium]